MNTYLTLFAIALASSLVLTPLLRRAAQRLGWVDTPTDARRVHKTPVPRVGGVAIYCAAGLALAALPFVDNRVTDLLAQGRRQVLAVLLSSTFVFAFGLFDDLKGGVRAKWKFLAQGLAALILYALGVRIEAVTVPLVGSFEVPAVLGLMLTLVWVIGVSNAFNLIDGLDGLATGAALFASLVMAAVSLVTNRPLVTVISLALVGALTGFLRYNFNPASIFMGDSGALFAGFLLAALSITGTQKASTAVAVAIPLMAFALPVIDTGFAITRRFISGQPLFEGDREHIHHKLLERGWSQRRVAFVLYGACAFFGLIAMLFTSDGGEGKLTGLLLLVTGAVIVLVAGRLRYHEADEVKAGLRRNLTERRARAANHVRVRRASRSLSQAQTLGDLLAAMREILEPGEFVYATVQLGRGGDRELSREVLARAAGDRRLEGVEERGGLLCWEWARGAARAQDILDSHLFWTLRMPLSTASAGWGHITLYRELGGEVLLLDVNYLANLFQKEMALAAERVFMQAATEREPLEKAVAAVLS